MNEFHAALLLLAALLSPALIGRRPDIFGHAGAATAGTLSLAYGGREVLRALGGGYYCCSHGYYAVAGGVLVFAGWIALLPTLGIVEPPRPPNESAERPNVPEKP
ncbi:hypothetical protein HUG10_16940 [Halorarum halophilum]|uniref:Uncharacterized protein n=1 Tax=Halorarum halophilum TaxID=2743090 RepID=A0A7D5GDN7_9EURY|nr:hypothetical protein [Halobaculum halophilum]QLG29112.1 hypothetical protein HUG10_16940 [Halobaculum halophilum]